MTCRYAERDFEKLEEARRQLLALQDVKQNARTGLKAVANSAEGSQAISPSDDSLKRQATKLETEDETQKKKLKMDNLTKGSSTIKKRRKKGTLSPLGDPPPLNGSKGDICRLITDKSA